MFKGKKELLSKLLNYSGGFELLKRINRKNLYTVSYHRLYSGQLDTIFDDNVFGHSEISFLKHMKWFKENFDIFSEADLINHLAGNKPLKRRTVIITFDDGYLDNYTIAYPILKKLEIPAIFFIPCNQISGSAIAWWDVLSYFAKTTTKKEITAMKKTFDPTTAKGLSDARYHLCWQYKILPVEEAKKYLLEVHKELDIQESIEEIMALSQKEFMNWEQIKELSDNNIAIASHTMNHQVLSKLTPEMQSYELNNSKDYLEKKVNKKISTIAYPVGKAYHFNEDTKRLTKEAGYQAGFSFIDGYEKTAITDRFSIPRFVLSDSTSFFKAQTLLAKYF